MMMEEVIVIKTSLIFRFLVFYASIASTFAADTLSVNQTVRYNETVVSRQETFELGFFRPGKSMNIYVGIWYKKIPNRTVVWVANRNTPLAHTSCELTLTPHGVLIIRDATKGDTVWSSVNSSSTTVKSPTGRLLDTGNFIIHEEGKDDNQGNPVWQSFDYMTDTLLPGMKVGWDLVTGIDRYFTSWKSDDDPAVGEFAFRINTSGYPQLFMWEGNKIKFRGGPWNGLRFTGISQLKPNPFYSFTFVVNEKEIYYQYNLIDTSAITRLVLQVNGLIERFFWIDSRQEWNPFLARQNDICDQYALCGQFASCNVDKSPVCECLNGFEPAYPDQWKITDWSHGCRYIIPLDCDPGEGFNKYSNLKLPDTRESWYNQTMTLVECEKMCKSKCSCTAYTYLNISGTTSGCLLWFGGLIDIRTFSEGGDTLYIRLSASELDSIENTRRSSNSGRSARRRVLLIVLMAVVVLVILVVSVCLFYRYNRKKRLQQVKNGSGDEDIELLPLFGLSAILKATNNFSMKNKLGEGGFGPVYKGVLEDGHEIAVKRLAKTSTQGVHEFMNEVISISKLQHRNLVKLLGCCIEGAETMLIYEYMPNKSLDSFIFDKTQSQLLDWPARYHIIEGIARGLLYLHQDSRLRIIHRDLKASNILLDKDMNPKISDFGLARTFGGNQNEANTNRVVGTYGYMAPEYAARGIFSIKSDIYSFGVLVLEIVSGEKNKDFSHQEHCNNLIGHDQVCHSKGGGGAACCPLTCQFIAWGLHNEGRSLQLVAKCLGESINVSQVLRSIHVGLLCVQCQPEDRPTMTNVILMLGGEGSLPSPNEPGFYVGKSMQDTTQTASSCGASSNNELSITMLNGR